jgi:hypothetical protein
VANFGFGTLVARKLSLRHNPGREFTSSVRD